MPNNKMLIDSTHAEETRVVVLRGDRVEEFDFESAARKPLRGNIYLAKVTRVEPSLQAAFVDYGGNRHGFLAFSEIHPDYYQIPVADRQALLAEEARAEEERARGEDRAAERSPRRRRRREQPSRRPRHEQRSAEIVQEDGPAPADLDAAATAEIEGAAIEPIVAPEAGSETAPEVEIVASDTVTTAAEAPVDDVPEGEDRDSHVRDPQAATEEAEDEEDDDEEEEDDEEQVVEAVGGADVAEEVPERPMRVAPRRYKIQEVIKRRQVILVQVVKEERGNKGAALTTYLSLAGRYSVLMPNTARGGGISRKITSAEDRKRLKDIVQDLEVPEGMGVILRTAGASRTKAEVKRDFEYLMRLWESVAELTLKSQAPALVYEEGSLVKRAIRDLYNKDIDDVTVAGEDGYREAKDFMRMLMPSHAKNVQPYREDVPLFTRFGIESQLDQMFQPQVQLRSGGYIVLNQTEALVSIDVNSGRATREHNIEDTALKTNLEAADEVARQLRLRDLAGLIVIDFIDMEEKRNNRAVERRMKECLKQDRARIQVGRISHFGLLEMSRQRIRTSVLESTTEVCPHCNGVGHVRSPASSALQILRMIEEALLRDPTHNVTVRTRTRVALYVLNQKRLNLRTLEERFGVAITIDADENLPAGVTYAIEKGEISTRAPAPRISVVQIDTVPAADLEEPAEVIEDEAAEDRDAGAPRQQGDTRQAARDGDEGRDGDRRRRRRRRRRGGRDGEPGGFDRPISATDGGTPAAGADEADEDVEEAEVASDIAAMDAVEARGPSDDGDSERRRRRRGRRGGRRNGRDGYEGERPATRDGDRPPRLEPVQWVQPGEEIAIAAVPEPEPVRDETMAEPAVALDAAPSIVAQPVAEPAAAIVTPPPPEPDPVPTMPRIPDLPSVEIRRDEAEDPARPRRAGWWNRARSG